MVFTFVIRSVPVQFRRFELYKINRDVRTTRELGYDAQTLWLVNGMVLKVAY